MAKRTDPAVRWLPSPEPLAELFRSLVDGLPGATRRAMFGYPTATVNGNMFACLKEDRMALRLSPADRETMLGMDGAAPFEPMPGRPWKEYVIVPESLIAAPADLRPWVERSCDYTRGLPPKLRKPRDA
jgi:TfoX/Sxy family transcriptional regulator of competence genes